MKQFFTILAIGLAASGVAAQCLPATGTMIASAPTSDFITTAQPLGFAFPYTGTTYTDIHVSDHGICFLSNGGVPAPPAATPFVYDVLLSTLNQNGPVIAPFWGDHTTGGAGEVWLNSSATDCTITWKDIQTYPSQLPAFTFQMTLSATGDVTFRYDSMVDNYGSTFAPNAIIGTSPGGGATLPASSDLTANPVSAVQTIFQEFTTPGTADVAGHMLSMVPTGPGWVVLDGSSGCAAHHVYGAGCYGHRDAIDEFFTAGSVDLAAGDTISFLRQSNGYLVLDAIPGSFVAPTAAAINVAAGQLDGDQPVTLSASMPTPGGSTNTLVICTKGYISLSAVSNGIDFSPTAAEFLAFATPTIAPMWHDWNQTQVGSGLILFEEIGGIAYVTWNGVYSLGGTSVPTTFQVQCNVATGDITVVYTAVGNDGGDYVVGITAGNSVYAPAVDLSADLAATLLVEDSGLVPLTLDSGDPILGVGWDLTTTHVDPLSPIAITFFGTSQVNPGLDLGFLGGAGCQALIQPIAGSLTGAASAGTATMHFPLPSNPGLAGLQLTAQSICLTLANSLNLLTSNGVAGTLGH